MAKLKWINKNRRNIRHNGDLGHWLSEDNRWSIEPCRVSEGDPQFGDRNNKHNDRYTVRLCKLIDRLGKTPVQYGTVTELKQKENV
jgi:hypothetical protein